MTRPWAWHEKAQAERGRRGWSYAELGRRIGEDGSLVARWLKGRVTPREGVVAAIARVYGWPVQYLTDPATPYPPPADAEWARMVLEGLDAEGRALAGRLLDRELRSWLFAQMKEYDRITANLRGRGTTGRPEER